MPALWAGIFSVLGGRTAELLPEGLCEITHVLKSTADCNVGYFLRGFRKQLCGVLDPVLLQILNGSGSDGIAETAQAFTLTDRSSGSNISGGEFAVELSVNAAKHGFDPLCIP